jgi:site-specific DNA-methyltransferase (adenine-specific)
VIFKVGRHRIAHGDCRDADLVARLLEDAKPNTLVFDPPWDCPIPTPEGDWKSILAFTDGRRIGDVVARFGANIAWLFVWDCGACMARNNRPFQRFKCCVWYGDVTSYRWRGARLDPRGDQPRGKKLADLYSRPITIEHRNATGVMRYAKPLEWVRCLVGNCAAGDVFDPCLGSGTTLLACEQTGFTCYGVERDDEAFTVLLERLSAHGLEAIPL